MPNVNWTKVVEQAVASRKEQENIFTTFGGILQISRKGIGTENIILRVLAHEKDDIPILTTYKHLIKAGGKMKQFFCYKNVGKSCPVCEQSMRMYRENKNGNWYSLRSTDTFNVNVLVAQADNTKLVGKTYTLQLDLFRDKELISIFNKAYYPNTKAGPFDLELGGNWNICAEVKEGSGRFSTIDYSKSKWEIQSPINIDGNALSADQASEIIAGLRSLTEYKETLEVPDMKKFLDNLAEETGLIIDIESDKTENIPKTEAIKKLSENSASQTKAEVPEIATKPEESISIPVQAAAKPAPLPMDDDEDDDFMNRLKSKHIK